MNLFLAAMIAASPIHVGSVQCYEMTQYRAEIHQNFPNATEHSMTGQQVEAVASRFVTEDPDLSNATVGVRFSRPDSPTYLVVLGDVRGCVLNRIGIPQTMWLELVR